ncbi:MAG: hypothetical protein ACYSU0_16825, partial [Planctomycetota bacterium]
GRLDAPGPVTPALDAGATASQAIRPSAARKGCFVQVVLVRHMTSNDPGADRSGGPRIPAPSLDCRTSRP